MSATPASNEKIRDLEAKVRNARKAAGSDGASERDKADLKLLEQQAAGEKLRAKHEKAAADKPAHSVDAKLDKALKDTFPGSDPVSFVQAAPVKEGDEALATVPEGHKKAKKGG